MVSIVAWRMLMIGSRGMCGGDPGGGPSRALGGLSGGGLGGRRAVQVAVCGMAAGTCGKLCVYPLDTVKKRAQVGGLVRSSRYGAHVGHDWFAAEGGGSSLGAARAIARDEGARALYKGLVPTLLKVAPAAGVTFVCYEWCKAELLARGWRDDDRL